MPAVIPFIPLIASGLGFAGGLIGNKSKSTSTPNYGPLQGTILDMIKKRLGSSADMSGYTSQGLQNTNRAFDLIGQSQSNDLTARGLGTSPIAGTVDAMRQNKRAGAVSSFQNSIPLLQRQLQGDDLALAGGLFGGRTNTGESGGGLGGGLEGLAAMLGWMQGQGKFPGMPGGGRDPLASRMTVPGMGFLPPGGVSSMG